MYGGTSEPLVKAKVGVTAAKMAATVIAYCMMNSFLGIGCGVKLST
jgi:hypothetical protein